MTIGDRIKERRISLGFSATELGDRIGKDRSTIYRYEKGDIENLPFDILEPIANVLHTTPAYLMGWTNDASPNAKKDTPDENNLTEGEKEFLDLFRMLPDEEQRIYLEMLRVRLNARKAK